VLHYICEKYSHKKREANFLKLPLLFSNGSE